MLKLLPVLLWCSARTEAVLPTLCTLGGKKSCVVTPPTACPVDPLTPLDPLTGNQRRFGCTILDLRIAVSAGASASAAAADDATVAEYGLLVRFIIPSSASAQKKKDDNGGTPLLFRFHGTGSCGLEVPAARETCACSPDVPCSVADGCKDFQVAQEGVLVVRPAERGTAHCYGPADPMQPTATWLGQLEFEDYDTLLEALLAPSRAAPGGFVAPPPLHPLLPADVDASRVGVSGGSHGGIASFLYPVFSRAPSVPRFALAMPFEGTPDVASTWFGWQYDAETLAATGNPLAIGFAADAGAVPQVAAWPQSTLARVLAAAYATGNQTELVAFLEARTAYDTVYDGVGGGGTAPLAAGTTTLKPPRTMDVFNAKVAALLMHLGGRDCIIPGYEPHAAWELLRSARYHRPHDLLLWDNYPHSCHATGGRFPTPAQAEDAGGYGPLWTDALQNKTDAISSSLWVSFVRRFLLLEQGGSGGGSDGGSGGGSGDGSSSSSSSSKSSLPPLPLPGALVASIGHDVADAQYRVLPGGSVAGRVDGHTTFYLHSDAGDTALHAAPEPHSPGTVDRGVSTQSAASIAAACPQNNSTQPCGLAWHGAAWRASFDQVLGMWSHAFWHTALAETLTLSGAAAFTAVVRLEAADDQALQGGGVAAALLYSPPDAPAGYKGWLVTQGLATFDHTDGSDGCRSLRILLDHRLITLQKGGTLSFVLGNLPLGAVHHMPWTNPIMFSFATALVLGGPNATQASLDLPTSGIIVDLPPANTTAWENGYWR